VAYFGLLSGMVILLAYYANFFITPILLSSTSLTSLWDLLSISLRRELINHCGLFQGMQPRQIKRLILLSEVRSYPAGAAVMQPGQACKEMYVLLSGECEIHTAHLDGQTDVTQAVQVGQVVGLTAVVSGRPCTTTLTTSKQSRLLVLSWDSIQRAARLYPRASCQLYRNLSIMLGVRFVSHAAFDREATQRPSLPEGLMLPCVE